MQPTHETEEEEHARLIEEIIAREDIGYHPDSAHTKNHRATLEKATIEHLREIVKVHGSPSQKSLAE